MKDFEVKPGQEIQGFIHSLESFGTVDGPGVRFVVFMQGCLLRCRYCHNPDTWAFQQGRTLTAPELMAEISRYRSFIQKGGVTLSGGEPLAQPEFCAELLRLCRAEGLHTAVDTSGAVPLEHCRKAVDEADLLLLDIKALEPALCKALTGRDNTEALNLLRYCERGSKPVWLRHVLVPGITLAREGLERLADFIKPFTCVQKVELLPFHKLGAYKWKAMKLPFSLAETPEPSQEELELAAEIFRSRALTFTI